MPKTTTTTAAAQQRNMTGNIANEMERHQKENRQSEIATNDRLKTFICCIVCISAILRINLFIQIISILYLENETFFSKCICIDLKYTICYMT